MSTEIQYNLTINAEMTYAELRRLEISLIRVMSYVQRFSGNTDLNKFIQMIEKVIVTIRTLQIAMRALEMASGPIGWLYAGTTVVAAGLSGMSIYDSITGV